MIKTKLAKKVLTKKEQKHLTNGGIKSMNIFRRQIDWMKKESPEDPGSICRECWYIAHKLRMR